MIYSQMETVVFCFHLGLSMRRITLWQAQKYYFPIMQHPVGLLWVNKINVW